MNEAFLGGRDVGNAAARGDVIQVHFCRAYVGVNNSREVNPLAAVRREATDGDGLRALGRSIVENV